MEELLTLPIKIQEESLIKVMGVGGGGCNSVNYLYGQGVEGISFLVCNTDRQALGKSSVPAKLQLGPGLGAGGEPTKAEQYAKENKDSIREALDDGTQMLFITAGMGGGTGTGASAIVAEVAKEMGILTVGIVTIPFAFEGEKKIRKAMIGVAKLAEKVDAILIINNEKLIEIHPDLTMLNAFQKANDVVANAARSIAEIITIPSDLINTDFADVYNTLKDGKVAIMNVGHASGEDRISKAIQNALNSPLINSNDIRGAKRVLLQIYCSKEHAVVMQEFDQIHRFVSEVGSDVEVQWGASVDDTLGEEVRITIIATGYDVDSIPSLSDVVGSTTVDEAIASNYNAKPEVRAPRGDDEKEVTIDLTIPTEETTQPQPAAESEPRPASLNGEQISIEFEEDTPTQNEEPRRGGWFRRNR